MSKPFTVTRTEARELKRIAERSSRGHRLLHTDVERRMRERMERELRGMVRAYRHPGTSLREVLELMAAAHAEGIDVSELCQQLLEKIASTRRRAA
jgi:hypothetical protein